MAEMLQAQSQQPTERFTYKGIEAHTPATAGLAKILQSLSGAYFQKEARDQEKALGEKYRQEEMDDITRYAEMAGKPAVAAVQGQDAFTPMGVDYEDRGSAPAFNLDEQGMVPAVDPIAARMRGQIDPSMIGELKTKRMQEMALARMLKQGELPAAFNLNAEETRFQPPVGGGAPVAVATGKPKPLPSPFAPLDVSKFTKDSVTAATNPNGTIDRTKLVAITPPRTGDLGVYDEYVKQEKEAGRFPKSIDKFITDQKIAGRTPAARRERFVYDKDQVGVVDLVTAVFTPATQDGKPLSPISKPLTTEQSKAAVFESQMRGATEELALIPGYDPNSGFSQAETALAGGRGNMLSSGNAQRAKQAQSQWAESFLRFKTGAASTPAEVASNVATFFPQLFDKPETIAQKKRMRTRAENDIAFASGNALSQKQNKQPGQAEPLDPLGLRRKTP
jgi:hypothetical protein